MMLAGQSHRALIPPESRGSQPPPTFVRVPGVGVDPDGNLLIADDGRNQVVRLDRSGRTTVIAGTGVFGYTGDGGPAAEAEVKRLQDVTTDHEGNIFFISDDSVRKVATSGLIETITSRAGFCSQRRDGHPASQDTLCRPISLAPGVDGSLYIADATALVVRRIGPDGIITTVAGTPGGGSADGWLATATLLDPPSGLSMGPDGTVFISGGERVRRQGFPLPGYSAEPVAIAAPNGRHLFLFDGVGRHLETIDTLTGHTVFQFEHDAAGRLTSVRDANGNITRIERDGAGRATAIVSSYGVRTQLTMGSNGYLASVRNAAGEEVQLTHTDGGLLTSVTDPRQGRYEFSYDELGRLTSDRDPAGGRQTLLRTTASNGYRVDVTSAEGEIRRYGVDVLATGDRTWTITHPWGSQSFTVFKSDGNRTTARPDGTLIAVKQGPDPRFGMQSPVPSSLEIRTPSGLTSSATRNVSAVLENSTNPLSMKTLLETVLHNGRAFSVLFDASLRRFTTTSAEGRHRSVTLDAQGRPIEAVAPGLAPIMFEYDTRGRVVRIRQQSGDGERGAVLAYDALGRLASITDQLGRVRGMRYDDAGRVTALELEGGRSLAYQHDDGGNLISVTPPSGTPHLFEYTGVALPSSYAPPAAPGATEATTYTYDLDHQLTRIARPGGELVLFQYDAAGRLAQTTLPEGDYHYQRSANSGRLTSITAPGAEALALSYDGFLPTRSDWSGPVAGSVARVYDTNFWITSESVNGANSVGFGYDKDGLLRSAGGLSISRDPTSGRVTGTTLGGVTTSYGYNSFGELMTSIASFQGAEIARFGYQRDAVGRIMTATETIGGAARVLAYSYDGASRLAAVDLDGSRLAGYSFDANGNRVSVSSSSGTTSATFDAQDRLVQQGDVRFTYRSSGELLSRAQNGQQIRYSFDAFANLRKVVMPDGVTIEYLIDGMNRRVGKKVDGVLAKGFLYNNQRAVVAEIDGSGAVVSRFVHGTAGKLPDYMVKGGVTYRIISDHLGSVRLVVNAQTGEVAQRIDYDAFGLVVYDTNPGFQPFGFAGGLYDHQTGLVRFGARDYDPEAGRWTTRDAALFGAGDSNLYAYALNDPVNLIDPEGLAPEPPATWPLPPGWTEDWTFDHGIRRKDGPRWWDPDGGEWRWHAPDKRHPEGHWDHRRNDHESSPWENVPHELPPLEPQDELPPIEPCDPPGEPPRAPVPWWQRLPKLPTRLPFPVPFFMNPCLLDPAYCGAAGERETSA